MEDQQMVMILLATVVAIGIYYLCFASREGLTPSPSTSNQQNKKAQLAKLGYAYDPVLVLDKNFVLKKGQKQDFAINLNKVCTDQLRFNVTCQA